MTIGARIGRREVWITGPRDFKIGSHPLDDGLFGFALGISWETR